MIIFTDARYLVPELMSDTHKAMLRRNFVELKKNMDPSPVIDQLYGWYVLTVEEHENVNATPTRHEKNDKLLSILERKDDCSFIKFRDALVKTSQEHVARLLGYRSKKPAHQVPRAIAANLDAIRKRTHISAEETHTAGAVQDSAPSRVEEVVAKQPDKLGMCY